MYTNEADVKVISRGTMIEDLILKNVTGGKNHESSLVFHFACNDENHEFHIKYFQIKIFLEFFKCVTGAFYLRNKYFRYTDKV